MHKCIFTEQMYFQCTNVFSVHRCISQCTNVFLSAQMYFSVHKYISQCTNVFLSAQILFLSAQIYFSVHKYISQCTNVFLSAQMYFSVPGYMVFPRISVARLGHFALVICLANRSAFENILIQHRKACFVLAVALKCKFPFHFVLVVAGALKVLMTQIAFHAVKNVGR